MKRGLRRAVRFGAVAFLIHFAATTVFVLVENLWWTSPVSSYAATIHQVIDWPIVGLVRALATRFPNVFYAMGGWVSKRSINVALIGPEILFLGIVGGAFYFLAGFALGLLRAKRRTGSVLEDGKT